MDGNNRWSRKSSLSKYDGYKNGAKKLISLTNFIFANTNVNFISAFALSKNNLQRSSGVLKIIKKVLLETLKDYDNKRINYDLFFIGDFNFLELNVKKKILSKARLLFLTSRITKLITV